MSNSLQPHGLKHSRSLCPSPTPRVYSNSCLLSWLCHPTILILCHPLLLPWIFPSIRVFSNESVLHIRWPKYWNFSFSIWPSNEYSRLISFRMDWLNLLQSYHSIGPLFCNSGASTSGIGAQDPAVSHWNWWQCYHLYFPLDYQLYISVLLRLLDHSEISQFMYILHPERCCQFFQSVASQLSIQLPYIGSPVIL